MRPDPTLRVVLLGVCALLSAACAPRMYQRETLQLDHRDLEQFEIRYADFDGCLLQRPVPVSYRVKRALYTLSLDVHFGTDASAAGLDIGVLGSGDLSARFPDLAAPPSSLSGEDGVRYRFTADALRGSGFTLEVFDGKTLLAQEIVMVRRESCRAISFGNTQAP